MGGLLAVGRGRHVDSDCLPSRWEMQMQMQMEMMQMAHAGMPVSNRRDCTGSIFFAMNKRDVGRPVVQSRRRVRGGMGWDGDMKARNYTKNRKKKKQCEEVGHSGCPRYSKYCTVPAQTTCTADVLYSALLYSTLLYSTLLYSTLLYSTVGMYSRPPTPRVVCSCAAVHIPSLSGGGGNPPGGELLCFCLVWFAGTVVTYQSIPMYSSYFLAPAPTPGLAWLGLAWPGLAESARLSYRSSWSVDKQ